MTKEMLLQDQEFVTYIMGLETEEDVKKAFADKGEEITSEEIESLGVLITAATAEEGELDDEEMSQVAGGIGWVAAIKLAIAVIGCGMEVYTFLKNNPEVKRAAKKGINWAVKKVRQLLG